MIKCEIVREKLFLEEERPSIGVQSENGCPFIDDDCCLHWGEWRVVFVKQRALVLHFFKVMNRIEPAC